MGGSCKTVFIPSGFAYAQPPPLKNKGRLFAFFKAPLLYKGELSTQLT